MYYKYSTVVSGTHTQLQYQHPLKIYTAMTFTYSIIITVKVIAYLKLITSELTPLERRKKQKKSRTKLKKKNLKYLLIRQFI